jgi:hypothetical protein
MPLVLHAIINHPELAGRRYLPFGYSEWASLTQTQVEEIKPNGLRKSMA